MLDLQPIKVRLAAATPGPWEPAELQGQSRRNSFFSVAVVGRREVRAGIPCQAQPDECDADLIAHAPTDIAALVAEVERLENEAAVMQQVTLAGLAAEVVRLRGAIKQFSRDTDGAQHPRDFGAAYARLMAVLDA